MNLLLVSFAAASLLSGGPDRVVLVRVDPGGKQSPLYLNAHESLGAKVDFVGQVSATAADLKKAAGKKPIRFALAGDWDGDGFDELLRVREWAAGDQRLELWVDRMPKTFAKKPGKRLASSKKTDLGFAAGDGRVEAIGSGDADGDGRDELWVVRSFDDQSQSLELRVLPNGKKKAFGATIGVDPAFGDAVSDRTIALFGSDVDDDGVDEIVALRRDAFGVDRLLVFEAPGADDDVGAPIASYADVTPADGFVNLGASRLDVDDDGVDEVMLAQRDANGVDRLMVHALPTAVGQTLGSALASDATPGAVLSKSPLFAAFGARRKPGLPQVSDSLNGAWRFTIFVAPPSPSAPGALLGPFPVQASAKGSTVTFQMTPSLALSAAISGVNFPAATLTFVSGIVTYPIPTGGTATLDFGAAQLQDVGGVLTITGSCGGGACGTIDGLPSIPGNEIAGYLFTKI